MITQLKQCETSIVLPPRSPSGFELDWNELFASLRICGDRSSLAFEHSMMFTPFDLPTSLDALPQFALLGILAGTVTGLVILLFRGLIEFMLFLVLPEGPESFEMLSLMERALTPIAGAFCIALYLFFQFRGWVSHMF